MNPKIMNRSSLYALRPLLHALRPVLLALCSLHFYALADHITVQGEVSGQWNTDTVFVAGELDVPDGQNLEIMPGTVVRFLGNYAVQVRGSVYAIGLPGDSIYFEVADTTGFGIDSIPDGGWRGIRFDHTRSSNYPSTFNLCRFSNGKMVSNDPQIGNGGAFSVKAYDNVLIIGCLFRDNFATFNGGAISLDSANITITDCRFENNRCGPDIAPWGYGGAVSSDNSSPEIRWNVFENNSSTGIGGGLSVRYKDCNVYNNVFTGNFSALGGALGVLHIPEINFRINNNLFAGNTALYFGGGVATINSNPVYINNTIVDNSSTYGGGFYCKDSISPDFYNTIIWGNSAAVGPQGYMFEIFAQADFFNCDVEGGPAMFGGSGGGEAFSGEYENCLDEDPLFFGLGHEPYLLTMESPCIDAGSADTNGFLLPETDLAGLPRQSGAVIDIGAYEYFWESIISNEETEGLLIWPNPTVGKFNVHLPAVGPKCKVEGLEIIDISGKCVFYIENVDELGTTPADIGHLPPGLYLVRISTTIGIFEKRLLKSGK